MPIRNQLGAGAIVDRGLVANSGDVSYCLAASAQQSLDGETETLIATVSGEGCAHALRAKGFDASEDGTGRGTPIIAFGSKDHGADAMDGVSPTLRAGGHSGSHQNAGVPPAIAFNPRQDPDISGAVTHPLGTKDTGHGVAIQERAVRDQHPCVAFDLRGREGGAMPEGPHDTANLRAASGGSSRSYVAKNLVVRRLTPRECERLQGFPDDFTNIPWRGKDHAPDGPRYKALGNSMAVNVMHWIGERIEMVDKL